METRLALVTLPLLVLLVGSPATAQPVQAVQMERLPTRSATTAALELLWRAQLEAALEHESTECTAKLVVTREAVSPERPLLLRGTVHAIEQGGIPAPQLPLVEVELPRLNLATQSAADGTFRLAVPERGIRSGSVETLRVRRIGVLDAHQIVPVSVDSTTVVSVAVCTAFRGFDDSGLMSAPSRRQLVDRAAVGRTGRLGGALTGAGAGDGVSVLRSEQLIDIDFSDQPEPGIARVPYRVGPPTWRAVRDEVLRIGDLRATFAREPDHIGGRLRVYQKDRTGTLSVRDSLDVRGSWSMNESSPVTYLRGSHLFIYSARGIPADYELPLPAAATVARAAGEPADSTSSAPPATLGDDVWIASGVDSLALDRLHTLVRCDLAAWPLACNARVIVAPRLEAYTFSDGALILATRTSGWFATRDSVQMDRSLIVRIPLAGGDPDAFSIAGRLEHASAMRESDAELSVLVRPGRTPSDSPIRWERETEPRGVALLTVPFNSVAERAPTELRSGLVRMASVDVRRGQLRSLTPPILTATPIAAFVGRNALWAGTAVSTRSSEYVVARADTLVVASLDADSTWRLPLRFRVERIVPLGERALLVGSARGATHAALVQLGGAPSIVSERVLPNAVGDEMGTTTLSVQRVGGAGDERYRLGWPVATASSDSADERYRVPDAVWFLETSGDAIASLGLLRAGADAFRAGDRIGFQNRLGVSQAALLGDRVLAVFNEELVEGRILEGRVVEVYRTRLLSSNREP